MTSFNIYQNFKNSGYDYLPFGLEILKKKLFRLCVWEFLQKTLYFREEKHEAKGLLIFTVDVMNVFCPNVV